MSNTLQEAMPRRRFASATAPFASLGHLTGRCLKALILVSCAVVMSAACSSVANTVANQSTDTYALKMENPVSPSIAASKTQYAVIDDRNIAYRMMGKGSPIVLINRFRGTLDTWDPLFLELLAQSHTVITLDYPGIGYSEGTLPTDAKEVAAEVAKLAEHLQLEKYDVLGWSYGGMIAQYVAFLYPERVGKAVLIGTNPPGKNAVPFEPIFVQTAFKPEYDLNDYTVLFFEPDSAKSKRAAKSSMERTWPGVDQTKVPKAQELLQRYVAGLKGIAIDEMNFRSQFASTDVPMLAISGDHDISFSVDNWYPLIRNAPTLQLISMPDAGHAPHFQYPELSVSYISIFLK